MIRSRIRTRHHGRMELRVLGPLLVQREGALRSPGGRQERLLLAVLVAGLGEVVSTDRIASALWTEPSRPSSKKSIQALGS